MLSTAPLRLVRSRSRSTRLRIGLVAGLLVLGVSSAQAQVVPRDTAAVRRDSIAKPAPQTIASPVAVGGANSRGRFSPPLTPRRAFVYSAILPGLGQSRLDRGSSGALFAAVELAAVVMVRRSLADLREARRYQTDTLPSNFAVGTGGRLTEVEEVVGRYDADLVRTRRLHVEDWLAALAFNHLFSGADAFVAAQLWDIPVRMSAVPTRTGATFVASLRF